MAPTISITAPSPQDPGFVLIEIESGTDSETMAVATLDRIVLAVTLSKCSHQDMKKDVKAYNRHDTPVAVFWAHHDIELSNGLL